MVTLYMLIKRSEKNTSTAIELAHKGWEKGEFKQIN